MRTLNIKTRLTLWYLLIITILLLFSSVSAYFLLSRSLDQKIALSTRLYQAQVTFPTSDGVIKIIGLVGVESINPNDMVGSPIIEIDLKPETKLMTKIGDGIFKITTPTSSLSVDLSAEILAQIPNNVDASLYLIPSPNNSESDYDFLILTREKAIGVLSKFKQSMFVVILVTLGLTGILGFILIRRAFKPLQEITQTANEIEGKNLNRRIKVQTYDEIGKLTITLNHMFDRLEKAFDREKQFTADASHELRTPLAIVRGEATFAIQKTRTPEEYHKSMEIIAKETAHMSSIVQRLLFLARYDNDQQLHLEAIDLSEFLSELYQDAQALAEIKNIKVQADINPNILIKGDLVGLRELFLNLIDNAVRYTPPNGQISILLEERREAVCISIQDTGIGIPSDQLPNIFNRFYRVDKTRSRSEGGAGLGLAICQRIAELHGGKISVKSEEGKGTTFTLYLPFAYQKNR